VDEAKDKLDVHFEKFNHTFERTVNGIRDVKNDVIKAFSGRFAPHEFRAIELVISVICTFYAILRAESKIQSALIILIFTTATGISSNVAAKFANLVDNYVHIPKVVDVEFKAQVWNTEVCENAFSGFVECFRNMFRSTSGEEKALDIKRMKIFSTYASAVKHVKVFSLLLPLLLNILLFSCTNTITESHMMLILKFFPLLKIHPLGLEM
jgi:hypothetical protein